MALDNYQRPYVWDEVKVCQLINDLLEHQQQGVSVPPYYMGTLLLHKNEEKSKYFVIDGTSETIRCGDWANELK